MFTNIAYYTLSGFSPQANYTDWATATCWRNLVPIFADWGVLDGQRGGPPTVVNLSFLGSVDPVPVPLLHRKYGSAENRTWDPRVCSQ
jgi:hypothetical protein